MLAFVNTRLERPGKEVVELLGDVDVAGRWLRIRLGWRGAPRLSPGDLEIIAEFRCALRALLRARIGGAVPDPDDLYLLNAYASGYRRSNG